MMQVMSNKLHATDAVIWLVRLDFSRHMKVQSVFHQADGFILYHTKYINFRLFKHMFALHQRQLSKFHTDGGSFQPKPPVKQMIDK